MKSNYDIIIFSLARWDGKYSSTAFSLAKELSKNNRVFYIDNPFTYKDFVTRYRSKQIRSRKRALLFGKDIYKKDVSLPEGFVNVTSRLTIPINFLKKGRVYDFLSSVNNKIVFSTIRRIIRDNAIKKFIFFNSFNPYYAVKLPSDISPFLYVYQTVDNIAQESYIARHGVRLEREAVKSADLVLATSLKLTNTMAQFSKDVHYLPNAADISLFKQSLIENYVRPKEIYGISKKIIGYIGNIDFRLNYELIKSIANQHTDKVLLMVGPLGSNDYKNEGLDKLPNVIFTGPKRLNELPRYLKFMDCAIIPFKLNELTKSIYPLKINEYLAGGKPVVSTNFSEDINQFSSVSYVAGDEQEFLLFLNQALQEDTSQREKERTSYAALNSWEARVERFWNIIKNHKIGEIEASYRNA